MFYLWFSQNIEQCNKINISTSNMLLSLCYNTSMKDIIKIRELVYFY
jgi:hypothetical protein